MLAADKLLLQSNVKQRSIELREKELKLFNTNFSAVGTQAAIMAGFTLTSFVEIDLPPEKKWAKAMLHCFITLSICINFITVAMVTFVTVWGGGKALRGQDGSMDYAVDEMNAERTFIVRASPLFFLFISRSDTIFLSLPQFASFGLGIIATLGCLCSAAWVLMEAEIAAVASCLILGTMYLVVSEARRIRGVFYMEAGEMITFKELRDVFPDVSGTPNKRYSSGFDKEAKDT